MSLSSRKQECHCGHDVATHYLDPSMNARVACLARGCDCRYYADSSGPKPVPTLSPVEAEREFRRKSRPHADLDCRCAACLAWSYKNWSYQ